MLNKTASSSLASPHRSATFLIIARVATAAFTASGLSPCLPEVQIYNRVKQVARHIEGLRSKTRHI